MKKQLLSTSAIALGVAMAAPATAQQWDLDWGGFANTHIGATDINGSGVDGQDFDGVDVYTNSEIIFRPSVTLDNGLTFGFTVEYEALNGGGGQDGIDESFAYMESDTLGRVEFGSHNSAGYLLMARVYTPGVDTMAVNSNSTFAFIPATGSARSGREAAGSSITEVGGNNDVQRISYFTPSFNGLTVGFSYAASGENNAANNAGVDRNAAGDLTDIFDIGVAYQQSFGSVDLGLAARWGTGDRNASPDTLEVDLDPNSDDYGDISIVDGVPGGDPTTWAVGGTIGVNAFTFGATYAENDTDIAGGVGDQEGYSFGVTYDLVGPWSIGAETYQGEFKNGPGVADDKREAYKVAAARDLGPGVSWNIYYVYEETKNGSNGNKIKGNLLGTAINLSF